MTLKLSSYLLPKFSRVPLTIVLIRGISTMVNGTLLNFGKRYDDNLRVIFDQWPKLHLGLVALSNQKNLEWYLWCMYSSATLPPSRSNAQCSCKLKHYMHANNVSHQKCPKVTGPWDTVSGTRVSFLSLFFSLFFFTATMLTSRRLFVEELHCFLPIPRDLLVSNAMAVDRVDDRDG